MRMTGFCVFVLGLVLGLWWVALLGIILFEGTGVTWIAVLFGGHGDHHDHGPMN